ncbi:MAG: class I SAM-dependent methyltransferase [Gemmatimonadaceae bacterium]
MATSYPHSELERRRVGPFARAQAWVIASLSRGHAKRVDARRRALIEPLRGRVLEIGPGSGTNLALFDPAVDWVGAEPSAAMRAMLLQEAARLARAIELLDDPAEALSLPDASVDAVVSTLVLCSVTDPRTAIAEVRRVLRPGGTFVFIEHVAAPPGSLLRRVQRAVRGPWSLCGGGCHPDRETWRDVEQAGFASVAIDRFRLPVPVVSPHMSGSARR